MQEFEEDIRTLSDIIEEPLPGDIVHWRASCYFKNIKPNKPIHIKRIDAVQFDGKNWRTLKSRKIATHTTSLRIKKWRDHYYDGYVILSKHSKPQHLILDPELQI